MTLVMVETYMKRSGSLYSSEWVASLGHFVYLCYSGGFRHVDSTSASTTAPNRLRISEMFDMTLVMVETYMKRSGSLYLSEWVASLGHFVFLCYSGGFRHVDST